MLLDFDPVIYLRSLSDVLIPLFRFSVTSAHFVALLLVWNLVESNIYINLPDSARSPTTPLVIKSYALPFLTAHIHFHIYIY